MTRPSPIPAPDRHQIENINDLYLFDNPASAPGGWRGRLLRVVRRFMVRVLSRQQAFNAAVVDHINRNARVDLEAHTATVRMIDWMEQSLAALEMSADDLRRHREDLQRHREALLAREQRSNAVVALHDDLGRYREALLARDQRANAAVAALVATHDELRSSVGVLQHATQSLKREVERLGSPGAPHAVAAQPAASGLPASSTSVPALDSYKYVGFEDQFRGTQADIRERLTKYLPVFAGRSDVLDVGCGRGEFLTLLGEHGITARGIDVNRAMVDVCRERGLDATEADALSYLQALPDNSLGGLIAAQVVEHLDPQYLSALLDAAFAKLRPGSPIVLETINPACWFAFFSSYIRDITHVRPLHPDTLKYLLVATGFQRVDIRYLAPYPEHDKLQAVAASSESSLADWAETINANAEKLNSLLFTWLDYAAIGRTP